MEPRFVGTYDDLVEAIALGSRRMRVTVKEAICDFIDKVEFFSFLSTLEDADKTVEDLEKDAKAEIFYQRLREYLKGGCE